MNNPHSVNRLMLQVILSFVLLVLHATPGAKAQIFGGNPGKLKWRQINNAAVRVIFPKGWDSAAARVANVSEFLQQSKSETIGNSHRKVSIVLQPEVTFSNAYVMLGPFRSEFYMMPPQDPFLLGSLPWTDNLAVHEYRHVQQYNNFNQGLSKTMRTLFGENGQALANAMSVPDWFFEGDAIWSETVWTGQGRGRMPAFLNAYGSVLRSGRKENYQQWRNGSLRRFIPNHYDLGYLLVSHGRQVYGDTIWKPVTRDAAAFKSLVFPFQSAFKKHTGTPFKSFVDEAFQDFTAKYSGAARGEASSWITPVSKQYLVNYRFPYPEKNGAIIALKSGYRHIPQFVRVKANGAEEKIGVRNIGYDDYFSYKNGRIVYSGYQPDARWGNRDYSVVYLLDTESRQTFSISKKTRWFAPDITADGQQLVAVEVGNSGVSGLVVFNTEGAVLQRAVPDSSLFLSHPKFLPGEQEIVVAARTKDAAMGWLVWNPSRGDTRWLLPPGQRLLAYPVVSGDTLFYSASEGGSDGLYAQIISSGRRFRLAQFPDGIYQGFSRDNKLVASCFTASGYRLGTLEEQWLPLLPENTAFKTLYPGQEQSRTSGLASAPIRSYTPSKYRKLYQPLRFHSLQPEFTDPDYTFRLYGNNVLNTTLTDLFYTYNRNETSHATGANVRYGGWYIQPMAGIRQTFSRDVFYNADTTFHYNETDGYAGFFLPLNFSGGKQYRYMQLQTTLHNDRVRWQGIGKKLLREMDYTFLQARLNYTAQIQKARQQIFPAFAQQMLLQYRTLTGNQTGWQLLGNANFYFPGVATNHSLVVNLSWQGRDTMRNYSFSNSFPFSRGYQSVNFPRMWKMGWNYHLPLFYPEWGFANMIYFLRVRANLFYDYTEVKSLRTGQTRPFSTAGTELFFDTRIWNQLPVSFGIRYSRLLDREFSGPTQPNRWELVLPVNLNG